MQERVHFKIHFMQLSSQLSWCTWWSIIGNAVVSVETLLYMLLVVAWSLCLHSQSRTSKNVGKWHPEQCLLGSLTGNLEHNWWRQVICEAALNVHRCEEDTVVVSFLFDIPWPIPSMFCSSWSWLLLLKHLYPMAMQSEIRDCYLGPSQAT